MRNIPYILLVATALWSCNPRLAAPQLITQREYIYGAPFSHDSIRLDNEWWKMFGDTVLNSLVVRAIERN